jgi:hypothetical protein
MKKYYSNYRDGSKTIDIFSIKVYVHIFGSKSFIVGFQIKPSQMEIDHNNEVVNVSGSTPNSVGFHIFTAWMNYQFSQQHWV